MPSQASYGNQLSANCGLPTPPSLATQFLENVLHAPAALAELRTVDEAVVIGAALSLSSSAFVLQVRGGAEVCAACVCVLAASVFAQHAGLQRCAICGG